MYPFERFTERAKKALALAQDEAVGLHHRHIGTEHLLLALFRQPESVAATTLASLGIGLEDVRPAIQAAVPAGDAGAAASPVPTTRVNRVIEHAFDEARRMQTGFVGTEHILLGLVVEGNGVAAHVLADRGAGTDAVREAVQRALAAAALERAARQRAGAARTAVATVLQAASQLASAEGSATPAPEHLLLALIVPGTPIGDAVAAGADLGAASRNLGPLAGEVIDRRARVEDAAQRGDAEAVERAAHDERQSAQRLRDAMRDWRRELGIGG